MTLDVRGREAIGKCCMLAAHLRDDLAVAVETDAAFGENTTLDCVQKLACDFDESTSRASDGTNPG